MFADRFDTFLEKLKERIEQRQKGQDWRQVKAPPGEFDPARDFFWESRTRHGNLLELLRIGKPADAPRLVEELTECLRWALVAVDRRLADWGVSLEDPGGKTT